MPRLAQRKPFGADGSFLGFSGTTGMGTAESGSVFPASCGRSSWSVLGGSGIGCTVGTGGTVDSACMISGSCSRNHSPAKTFSAAKG